MGSFEICSGVLLYFLSCKTVAMLALRPPCFLIIQQIFPAIILVCLVNWYKVPCLCSFVKKEQKLGGEILISLLV